MSGSYYKTKADGSYDAVEYDPKQHDGILNQLKMIELDGKKQVVPFYNYSDGFQNIDIEFDSKNNVLVCSRRIILIPKVVKNLDDGKEYPYENQKSAKEPYKILDREVTEETQNFIQEKHKQINALINYAGYYLSPSDCNVTTGCNCIVPVILKVSMLVQHANEPQHPYAKVINLFPSTTRADASNWGEVELKGETREAQAIYRVINGVPTKIGEKPKEKVEYAREATAIFLHEIAHLFGFPDEYFEGGGAVHNMYIKADTQTVDIHLPEPLNDWKRKVDGHLMSTAIPGQMPIIPPYYYERFRQYFENKTGVRWEIKKLST